MSQVSCGELRLRAPVVHRVFEVRERPTQGCVVLCHVGHHQRQAGTEEARVCAGEEEGQAEPGLGDPIAMRARDAGDQAMQAQAPQVVGHLSGGDRGQPEQGRQVHAEVAVAPAVGQQAKHHQHAEERVDDRVGEAQGGGPLTLDGDRSSTGERVFADRAIVADPLDVQETSVGLKADLPQGGEVRQPSADVEVVRVVDGRLRPERPSFLVVLLDPRVLVVDVQRGVTPSVITRVRNRPGVRLVTRRSKMSWTWSGRPMSRFSRMTSSKKTRPVTGRSSTWVRENSACRIESS